MKYLIINKELILKDIFIFGCPRSGKTTLARELHEKYGYSIISIDSIVDAFEKVMPNVGIGHSNTDFKFENLPKFMAQLYKKIKTDYPNVNFVIEGWHVLPKEIAKHIDLQKCVCIGLGFPKQDTIKKLEEIRKFSYENDYCQRMEDSRIIKLIENCKTQSLKIKQECRELRIEFFDLSNNWNYGQQIIREFLEKNIK